MTGKVLEQDVSIIQVERNEMRTTERMEKAGRARPMAVLLGGLHESGGDWAFSFP